MKSILLVLLGVAISFGAILLVAAVVLYKSYKINIEARKKLAQKSLEANKAMKAMLAEKGASWHSYKDDLINVPGNFVILKFVGDHIHGYALARVRDDCTLTLMNKIPSDCDIVSWKYIADETENFDLSAVN